ncbi:MAG: MFS transporter [Dehalococcoidia bacterium]
MDPNTVPVRRNIWLYYAFSFLAQFLLWAAVWIKYLIDDRGLELKWILAMDFPFWILVAVLQAPTGAFADHVGRRKVLALSGLLYAITILGFGLTTNYVSLFFVYVLWAFAMSMQMGADQALIYDTLKLAGREDRFKRVAGNGFAIGMFAALLGVGFGGVVAHYTSLVFTVQISALFPLLSIAAALAFWEPPVRAKEQRHYWRDLRAALDFSWHVPQVRYTLLVGAVLMTGTFGPVVLVQPFLLDFDVSDILFGWVQTPLRLVAVGGSVVAFMVGRRLGMPRVLLAGSALIFASYVGLALVGAAWAFAFFALPALVQGIASPLLSNHLNERIPSDKRATVLSVMQLAFALQVAFFEPALGFLADGIALRWAFVFAAAYFVVLVPPLLFLWRRSHAVAFAAPGPAESSALNPAPADAAGG